jgi:F-type H+-transporting ATPase subunit epsilon
MAEAQFQLEIVTPEGVQLNLPIDELTAPSVNGQFGVLPGHRPMLAALATGIITYSRSGVTEQVAVGSGYVEILNDRAIVLTDRFSTKAAVDPVRVRLDLKQADEALDTFSGELGSPQHLELVARELWAAALLELYGDPPPPTMRGFYEAQQPENYLETAAPGAGDEPEPSTRHE